MGPIEALKLALLEEKKAVEMYKKYAKEYPAAQETFNYLSDEEQKHKKLLEKKIVELTRY